MSERKPSDDMTLAEFSRMNPADMLQMVEEAVSSNARRVLSTAMDTLTGDGTLPLEGNNTVTASSPVPVPFGILKGRPELGELGLVVEVTYRLESLEPYRKATTKGGK